MKKLFTLLFILAKLSGFAQFSKTHFIPPIVCPDRIDVGEQFIYISTPSQTPVPFTIFPNGGGNPVEGLVSNQTPYVFPIGNEKGTPFITIASAAGSVFQNKGYTIEAKTPVYVSVRLTMGNVNQQAGGIVSKGASARGTRFRLGAMLNEVPSNAFLNFFSFVATQNNTRVTISDIDAGAVFSNGTNYTGPITVILNRGESYTQALENRNTDDQNCKKMIGALLTADKPIVVNCGSVQGTNLKNPSQRDIGFDQIVSTDKTGKEYIFVRASTNDNLEVVLLVADKPDTEVFLNEETIPFIIPNAGDYITIKGDKFVGGNLYVRATQNISSFQSISGTGEEPNQNLSFVPPINCATPKVVDNIPLINQIGTRIFTTAGNPGATLNIVTEAVGANLKVDGIPVTASAEPVRGTGVPSNGTLAFVRYTILGVSNNVSVTADKQVYVSFYGNNEAATYGGYYSGFDLRPELTSDNSNVIGSGSNTCLPELNANTLSAYNTFEWRYNGDIIPGAVELNYQPTLPGYYQVIGIADSSCITPSASNIIPVSTCSSDLDSDTINDNIDIDNDNDGIINCTESHGDKAINLSNLNSGRVEIANALYSNAFTGTITHTGPGLPLGTIVGQADGSFESTIPGGQVNEDTNTPASSVTYKLEFEKELTIGLEYGTPLANAQMNPNAEYELVCDVNKTITVLNPNNQLLIDTNYDGIFESDITEFTAFVVRFRLNSTTSLPGPGAFKFYSYGAKSISFTHRNLSETDSNTSSFKFFAACVPKDIDGDGFSDQLDIDSDNDGILDTVEAQIGSIQISNTDTNQDGLDDAFGTGFIPIDSDIDGVADYVDLDSDNDGILDTVEAQNLIGFVAISGIDTNNDGLDDAFGSGLIRLNTNTDALVDVLDRDSDGDGCDDVIEAGFSDPNSDGIFGILPVTVDPFGKVTGAPYTTPSSDYRTFASLTITSQPVDSTICDAENTTISVVSDGDIFQWQVSSNGTSWTNLNDTGTYSGTNTDTLTITSTNLTLHRTQYRVEIKKAGNACLLISNVAILNVFEQSEAQPTQISQCDTDIDGITSFNLTVNNDKISANYQAENFSYFLSEIGAITNDVLDRIADPTAYISAAGIIYVRVENIAGGCFDVTTINLNVSVTEIPNTFNVSLSECDDLILASGSNTVSSTDNDGISSFDLSVAQTQILEQLPLPPSNYTLNFYLNEVDALQESNPIANITKYRNILPGYQTIWARVEPVGNNDCRAIGPFVGLTVSALPGINYVPIQRECDNDQDGIFNFNTSSLELNLLGNQPLQNISVEYYGENGSLIPTNLMMPIFVTSSQTIRVTIVNNVSRCFTETSIEFIVDVLPTAATISSTLTSTCDNEIEPTAQDGLFSFDTMNFEQIIIGNQKDVTISYFNENGQPLPSPLPNPFVTGSQTVRVLVENNNNKSCNAQTNISFNVYSNPVIDMNLDGDDDIKVCPATAPLPVEINADILDGSAPSDYYYIWQNNGQVILGAISDTLAATTAGIYTVEVRNKISGCSTIRTVKVTESEIPNLSPATIVDLADINSITINTSTKGNYEYSINGSNGPFQDSNFFNNVQPGIYELYVQDKDDCGSDSETIVVLGIPKFFTPNEDGFNDEWKIIGIDDTFFPKSKIFIFDRYGKLLKQLNPYSNKGWDGTFNGYKMPSDDYWYSLTLDNGRQAKGHFSLKR